MKVHSLDVKAYFETLEVVFFPMVKLSWLEYEYSNSSFLFTVGFCCLLYNITNMCKYESKFRAMLYFFSWNCLANRKSSPRKGYIEEHNMPPSLTNVVLLCCQRIVRYAQRFKSNHFFINPVIITGKQVPCIVLQYFKSSLYW